jgi:hypothetical protein
LTVLAPNFNLYIIGQNLVLVAKEAEKHNLLAVPSSQNSAVMDPMPVRFTSTPLQEGGVRGQLKQMGHERLCLDTGARCVCLDFDIY